MACTVINVHNYSTMVMSIVLIFIYNYIVNLFFRFKRLQRDCLTNSGTAIKMEENFATTLNSVTRIEPSVRFEGFGRCEVDTGKHWLANGSKYRTRTGIMYLEGKHHIDTGTTQTLNGVCYKETRQPLEMKGISFVYKTGILSLNSYCYNDMGTRMILETGSKIKELSRRVQLDTGRRYEEPSCRLDCADSQHYTELSHRLTLNNSSEIKELSHRITLNSARRYEEKSTRMDLLSSSFVEPSTRTHAAFQCFEDNSFRLELENGSSHKEPTTRFELSNGNTYKDLSTTMELERNLFVEPSHRTKLDSGRCYKEKNTRLEMAGCVSKDSSKRLLLNNGCQYSWNSKGKTTMFGYHCVEPTTRFELNSFKYVENAGQKRQRGLKAGLEIYGHGSDFQREETPARETNDPSVSPSSRIAEASTLPSSATLQS